MPGSILSRLHALYLIPSLSQPSGVPLLSCPFYRRGNRDTLRGSDAWRVTQPVTAKLGLESDLLQGSYSSPLSRVPALCKHGADDTQSNTSESQLIHELAGDLGQGLWSPRGLVSHLLTGTKNPSLTYPIRLLSREKQTNR